MNVNASNVETFLSLRHLEKVYPNGEKAVYDFNLDIAKNEFIVIVGPSGCGKSTTLRMIAGLEDITSGEMYLGDELLNYKPSKDRHMAIVFQSYALYPQMTVYNNIAFPLTINKYPMPVVNAVLKANSEIEHLLDNVVFNKFIGVLFNVFNEKSKRAAKDEQIATILGVSLYAANLLCEVFSAYKGETLEALVSKENEIADVIRAKLKTLVETENAKIAESGIKLDGEFCELCEDGSRKMVQRKLTHYEIKTRVYETAEKLDLAPYLDKLPKELSGGQMQRVALGRAIVKNVPIFMMDEPLSNLDAKLRLTMRSEIVKLHNKINATTIYVTHDQTEAMTMASRIVVMSRGFIQQVGAPEEVYNAPANIFVAKFIGSPTMNMFEMEYDRKNKMLVFEDFRVNVDREFEEKFDKFYEGKCAEFSAINDNFDSAASEKILKILSVTGEGKSVKNNSAQKKNFIASIIDFFKKLTAKKTEEDPWHEERAVAMKKFAALKEYKENGRKVFVGIRPERIKIEKAEEGKTYKDAYIVQPELTELLGGEYNVYFEFCGKNMIGKIDAKDKLGQNEKIAVSFSSDDLFVFDPITGDVIR